MFLVSSDVAGYKLASNPIDLTKLQILFLEYIALKINEQIESEMNSSKNPGDELTITADDSPDEMRDKLDVMKGYMCP